MTALQRLGVGLYHTPSEPGPAVQFAGHDLTWFHRQGSGWCEVCLSPGTSRAANELWDAQNRSDAELLAFLMARVQACDLHQGFPWEVEMRIVRRHYEFTQQRATYGEMKP